MIYLDHVATTPVLEACQRAVLECNSEFYFNPSASYRHAARVREEIENARKTIADFLCCRTDEIYFTSGATESNNTAILSGAGKKLKLPAVTSKGEHASVYECFTELARRGIRVKFSGLNTDTSVKAEEFVALAGEDCGFASLIHVSNETGAINDVAEIFKEVKKRNPSVLLHADGVQAFCKIETNIQKIGAEFYSVSGHKVGASKGIGALYIKKGISVRPRSFGGGQENGMRSGTENVAGILGFAKAAETFARAYRSVDFNEIRQCFSEILLKTGNAVINGSDTKNAENILSMSVIGIKSEVLQRILADRDDIIIGTGSACASSKSGNRVLSAAGKTQKEIEGNIRIGFGIDADMETAEYAANQISKRIVELREKRCNG